MSATPTPRTDEEVDRSIEEGSYRVSPNFARTLECELNEANAILGALQELHGCSREMVAHWCGHAAERSLAVARMRNELAAEREKVRVLRAALTRCAKWGISSRNYCSGESAAIALSEEATEILMAALLFSRPRPDDPLVNARLFPMTCPKDTAVIPPRAPLFEVVVRCRDGAQERLEIHDGPAGLSLSPAEAGAKIAAVLQHYRPV